MNVDKEKLKSLLWSVVASWKADDGDLLRHADALEELLGNKTVEEVALLLIEENEALRKERDKLAEDKQGLLEDFAGLL
ncbi:MULTISPECIES: hypothetical protein [Pseudomonas]|uniref:hypothetical protein n=1 Tax=Pseudomonas TaxID=286 RepID=UPI0005A860E0|nr:MULTISPECIES: hypothetical protein [Pseudomonas]AZD93042.1 hypothetical protein C4K13_3625 [Pseudomonas chlororaphis subsp. aureofaciens]KAB0532794.1 hypothetical protein F7R16_11160 [Pseudomonas chlororaphis subsp. aureofaciens]TSD26018.1 hypothetical protein FCE86_031630 [Pseudomonas sp. ATCC 13985]WDG57841.1 hypothetical protein PUP52_18515 [Pseudomonas chlororaphis]WDG64054.1 hypothetical protein PUP59_18520 [Pseudomonas chlororaphis]